MKEGWSVNLLGDLIIPSGTVDPRKEPEKKFSYVDVSSVSRTLCEIVESSVILGKDAPSRARRLIKEGDVLFATVRPTLRRVAIVPKILDEEVCSTGYFVFRTKPEIENKFLFYYLLSDEFMGAMERLQSGASYPAVNDSQVKQQKIVYPSLSEQKRIVAILDEAFAGIDTAIANTEKNLANARELFESFVKSVFAKQHEDWAIKELGEVCGNLDSKRIPITKSKRKSGEIPYYGASGVVDHVADYIFDEDLLLVSEDGANLLARTYPIAFSISGKTWVNNHAHVLRFERMSSRWFIEYYLNSISLVPYVSGMAQPKLNQKALNSIPVPFPDDTQTAIVEKFDELSAKTKKLQDIYKEKLSSLNELKQSLLQKAFSGELKAEYAENIKDEAVK